MRLLREYVRELLLEKKWSDFQAPKGTTIPITPEDFADDAPPGVRDLDDEIFDLIQNAYSDVELAPASGDIPGTFGNIKVQKPEDLPGGIYYHESC